MFAVPSRRPLAAAFRILSRWRGVPLLLVFAGTPALARGAGSLPAIVFVSRKPIAAEPHAVPGLGPHHRAAITGGRLLVREAGGEIRELLPHGSFFDVADPAVSPDGRSVAFAGVRTPGGEWRIYLVDLAGRRWRALTRSDRRLDLAVFGPLVSRFERYDDLDPCWIGASELCFSSTRYPVRAQYADVPATNLFVIRLGEAEAVSSPERITMERNGADEPAYDPATDRIVFARWWFSRYRPATGGITDDPRASLARDSVNLWQAVSIPAHGGVPRLACGDPRTRRGMMAYQPCLRPGGGLAAVYALNLGLSPRPGGLGIQAFDRPIGPARRIAGAVVPDSAGSIYDDALGLAAPTACSPASLPDGRLIFSYAPGGRGDFGIYVVDAKGRRAPEPLVDLPGTLELDPAPVVVRRFPTRPRTPAPRLAERPALLGDDLAARGEFTYHSLSVFRSRERRTLGSPETAKGARIRFFAAPLRSAHETADTAIVIRETPVRADGSVEEAGLPADVPLFEQVVDSSGRVISGPSGPAHVAGFNAGRPGSASTCVGCHVGHSAFEPKMAKR